MARGDDIAARLDDLEHRTIVQERELVILANTIRDLADNVQQLAAAQVQILDSHDDLLKKIVAMDETISQMLQNR